MGEWINSANQASVPFLVWLQHFRSGALDTAMTGLTWLGTEYFYLLFFPFLYWCVSKRLGLMAGLGLMITNYMSDWVKWTLQLPRPPDPPVTHLWIESSPGFVSSHASTSAAVWGTLSATVRKSWLSALSLILILLISLSRMYLGVHFPLDVIGGWVVGLITMGIVLWLLPKLQPTLASWSPLVQVVAAFILVAVLLVIFPGNYDGKRPAEAGIVSAGVLLGLLLGVIWDRQKLNFVVQGSWGKRILRYVLGLILLLVAYLGLDFLFDMLVKDNYLIEQMLRMVRYTVVGLVVSGLGPWMFQRLRLA